MAMLAHVGGAADTMMESEEVLAACLDASKARVNGSGDATCENNTSASTLCGSQLVCRVQNASTADAGDAAEWMMISISTNSSSAEYGNTDEAIKKIVATKHLTIEGVLGANGMPNRTLALSEDMLTAFRNLTVFAAPSANS
uniref:Uncharacterized protein n=1 Tax=Globisporangium ultimum (strain ATCC 200006 / CBS 805.95 / DAOM BR144) TaxID=431595 RepID=K3X9J6_GLOUD